MEIIRQAQAADSAGIARVQVDSYRTAYAGLLPAEYLANFSYAEQEQDWRDWPTSHPEDLLYVAVDGGEVVGYALGRLGACSIAPYDSELLALHVRASHRRRGLGRQLMRAVVAQFARQGCAAMLLWVLAGNPARGFYERLGGQLSGEQTAELGEDITAVEVAYGWPDLKALGEILAGV